MLIDYSKKGTEIHAVIQDFDLVQTFDSGQCFRWVRVGEQRYVGISLDHILDVEQCKDRFVFRGSSMDTFEGYWVDYLDLQRDYRAIASAVSTEPAMTKATAFGWGLRVLLQEEWETMISFVLSSNNNVKRIKTLVEGLSQHYGRPIHYNGTTLYTFPRPEELAGAVCEDLAPIRCGYRAAYIVDAVQSVLTGQVHPENLRKQSYSEGVAQLLKIKGVGPKVADCIVLYGAGKYESYPVDVWVKRITQDLYFQSDISTDQIKKWAGARWGDLAGFAQQYLFYYARENQWKTGAIT